MIGTIKFLGVFLALVLLSRLSEAAYFWQAYSPELVAGYYLVEIDNPPGVAAPTVAQSAAWVAQVRGRYGIVTSGDYTHVIVGFAAALTSTQLSQVLADSDVLAVQEDHIMHLASVQTINAVGDNWGLDPLDQRYWNPLDNAYHYTTVGAGVNVYVVDSGITPSVLDFSGRVGSGYSAITNKTGIDAPGSTLDGANSHGTSVAGIIGGSKFGVAKGVSLIPVKVFDANGRGTAIQLMNGLEWVATNVKFPAAVNISLEYSRWIYNYDTNGNVSSSYLISQQDTFIDYAIGQLVNEGISVVVAAGNSNSDACAATPAASAGMYDTGSISVGALNGAGVREINYANGIESGSNYGRCVTLYAPGQMIETDSNVSPYITNLYMTSAATAMVTGTVARYLSANPNATPLQVKRYFIHSSYPVALDEGTGLVVYADGNSPTSVTSITATQGTTSSAGTVVNFGWSGANDDFLVAKYTVTIDGSIYSVVGNSYSVVLSTNASHVISVVAYDAMGNVSPPYALNYFTDVTPPTAPSNLKVAKQAAGSNDAPCLISWTGATDNIAVAGYQLTIDGVGVTLGNVNSYLANLSVANHVISIQAFDSANNFSPLVSISYNNVDTVAPSVPVALSVTPAGGVNFTLNWGAATDNVAVAGYSVIVDNGTPLTVPAPATSTALTLSLTKIHKISVGAFDQAGNQSVRASTTYRPPSLLGAVVSGLTQMLF